MMQLPLMQWTLHAENLPERFLDQPETPAFSLPGAAELGAFADLLGEDHPCGQSAESADAAYAIGSLFEDDLSGALSLKREIDFGALEGDYALLTFDHIAGSGEILLDGEVIARFGEKAEEHLRKAYDRTGMPCGLAADVTGALLLGRRSELEIRFTDARPAGVTGAAFLCAASHAHLSRVHIHPDKKRNTMTVRARVTAHKAGQYVLHVQPVQGGAALAPARETAVTLEAGEEKGVQLSLEVDAKAFVPGQAYDAPAMKIQLLACKEKKLSGGIVCDEALLMCGYGAGAPKAYLPLSAESCAGDASRLCEEIRELGISAVSLPAPAQDGLYRACTRMGISVLQHVSEEIRQMFLRYPCAALTDDPLVDEAIDPEAAAWQMAGLTAFVRVLDKTMTPEEMLLEASGRNMDAGAQSVRDVLAWLRTVQIRLRAEAVRQGRYQGALCSAHEVEQQDIRDALRTAFAPVHLSVLPLSGAWWTETRFSASVEAFVTPDALEGNPVEALCILEDDEGNALASFCAPCQQSGYLGVMEARLPDQACVLTLRCMLQKKEETGETIMEESVLPVYVGERAPLEAAF